MGSWPGPLLPSTNHRPDDEAEHVIIACHALGDGTNWKDVELRFQDGVVLEAVWWLLQRHQPGCD